jgi:eukaryotic-like serine/threonine-protein kinase
VVVNINKCKALAEFTKVLIIHIASAEAIRNKINFSNSAEAFCLRTNYPLAKAEWQLIRSRKRFFVNTFFMTPKVWTEIKSTFDEAVILPVEKRLAFVESISDSEIRLEVEKMLAVDDDESLDVSPLESLNLIGKSIGKYKILREIGRGGMGAVYEASRDDGEFSQKVALKLIKRGMDSDEILRRFRNERQILASLKHENITHLLDGGITENGSPYYVMEFVEGVSIDEFCENLSVDEKLNLFRQVCSAIAYAHARLVVHRDLKPSNVLVTADGTAKLLDFGIAKVLSEPSAVADGFPHKTATQFGMMTPQYASPEQIRGEQVTTSADVYSLGLLLYEILTGKAAFDFSDKSLDEIRRIITETSPRKPSDAVNRRHGDTAIDAEISVSPRLPISASQLKGDLDTIILKALNKEPSRRYLTVQEFSNDIKRYLDGMPVKAQPDSVRYRFGKFVKRNKTSVIAASLVFCSLIGGISVATWQAVIARRESEISKKRFGDVRNIANNVVFKYHDEAAKLNGSTAFRAMLVKDATEYFDKLLLDATDDLGLQKELALAYLKLGDVQGGTYQSNIGDTEGATKSFEKAFQLLDNLQNRLPADAEILTAYSSSLLQIGKIQTRRREIVNAIETLEKALRIQQSFAENSLENKRRLVQIYISLGDAYSRDDRKKTVEQKALPMNTYQRALEMSSQLTMQPENTPQDFQLLGIANQRIGNFIINANADSLQIERQKILMEAVPYHEKAIEIFKKLAESSPENLQTRRTLADELIMSAPIFAETRNAAKAIEYSKFAETEFEKLSASDTKNWELKYDLAMTYYQSAAMFQSLKNYPTGAEKMQRSTDLLLKLSAENPGNKEIVSDIKSGLGRLVDMTLWQEKIAKAAEIIEKNEAFHLKNLNEPRTKIDYDEMCNFYLRMLSSFVLDSKEKRQLAEKYLAKADAAFEKSSQTEEVRSEFEKLRKKLE